MNFSSISNNPNNNPSFSRAYSQPAHFQNTSTPIYRQNLEPLALNPLSPYHIFLSATLPLSPNQIASESSIELEQLPLQTPPQQTKNPDFEAWAKEFIVARNRTIAKRGPHKNAKAAEFFLTQFLQAKGLIGSKKNIGHLRTAIIKLSVTGNNTESKRKSSQDIASPKNSTQTSDDEIEVVCVKKSKQQEIERKETTPPVFLHALSVPSDFLAKASIEDVRRLYLGDNECHSDFEM